MGYFLSMYELSLKDKIAIITGAAGGIGKGIAIAFAKADAAVVVVDLDLPAIKETVGEIKKINRRVLGIKVNVAEKVEVDAMVDRVVKQFGTVDVLVNNAGRNLPVSLMNLREDGWDKTFDVNVKSCYLCTQAVGKIMIEKKAGSIINISSANGIMADKIGGAYCSSKSAVIQLSRAFAAELASYNIRVNCVMPGAIRTRMTQPLVQNEKSLRRHEKIVIPLGRIGEPEDVALPVLFLACEASKYMTGTGLMVDGGITISGHNQDENTRVLTSK